MSDPHPAPGPASAEAQGRRAPSPVAAAPKVPPLALRDGGGGLSEAVSSSRSLIEALRATRPFGHPVLRVEAIETHISTVLLAGEFAYKIKKPLDLGFLDFTTLAKRRFCCEEELRLNRRLAPAIYVDVVAITGSPDRPVLGGDGPVVDYAVKMREFPQDALASRMLEHGMLTAAHIDALAALVAAFHGRVAVAGRDGPYGSPAEILRAALDNFAQLAPLCDDAAERGAQDELRRWTETEHARCAAAPWTQPARWS